MWITLGLTTLAIAVYCVIAGTYVRRHGKKKYPKAVTVLLAQYLPITILYFFVVAFAGLIWRKIVRAVKK